MSRIFTIALILFASGVYAQEKEQRYNKETDLIEVVYYHDNGMVSQEGTFNTDQKLHGLWKSFNRKGEKIAEGTYVNGLKSGTWYFWAGDVVKEVTYSDNVIASVTEDKKSSKLVDKN